MEIRNSPPKADPPLAEKFEIRNSLIKGQMMLFTVLVLGTTLIISSTIAGYLMILKIRQSTDIANSARAVFAADAGIEWDLYRRIKDGNYPKPELTNGAVFDVLAEATSTKSRGTSAGVSRAFEISF